VNATEGFAAVPGAGRISPVGETAVTGRAAVGATGTRTAEAQLLQPVAPVYPSRCEAAAGPVESVTVRFGVSRFGKVLRPSVVESTDACFEEAALSAVSRFSFAPAKRGGRAVSTPALTTRIVFRRDR
jgi:TonB family protein